MNPRRQKTLEDTMKTVILTPNSSVKSSVTVNCSPSETRDSFYFPGCKKDANCNCEICIASMNATRDLMPHSTTRNSVTRFPPSSRIYASRSPVSYNPSMADLSTPKSKDCSRTMVDSPPPSFSERIDFQEKVKGRKVELGYGVLAKRIFWGLILVFGVDYGISWMVSGVFKTRLSAEIVKNLGLKSRDSEGLSRRMLFFKNELEGLVGEEVLSCHSNDDSLWEINQDGLFLHSRCVLYKSMAEEVSIWGWPLQTAGLLTTEFSSRSYTVISGRVTELSHGETRYLVRKDENGSWIKGKWTSSVVQFDPNTWILEYRRSFLTDNANLVSTAMEFIKFWLREFRRMKQEFWLVSKFGNLRKDIRGQTPPPT